MLLLVAFCPLFCSLGASAAMSFEPSSAEVAAMTTVSDVLEWALIKGALEDVVAQHLGLEPAHPARALAAIDEADIAATKNELKINEVGLAPAAKGMVGSAWRAARIVAKVIKSQETLRGEVK